MLTLEQCKKVLNKGRRKYSEEDIRKIRDYLYFIGHIEIETDNNENYNSIQYECYHLLQSKLR